MQPESISEESYILGCPCIIESQWDANPRIPKKLGGYLITQKFITFSPKDTRGTKLAGMIQQ